MNKSDFLFVAKIPRRVSGLRSLLALTMLVKSALPIYAAIASTNSPVTPVAQASIETITAGAQPMNSQDVEVGPFTPKFSPKAKGPTYTV